MLAHAVVDPRQDAFRRGRAIRIDTFAALASSAEMPLAAHFAETQTIWHILRAYPLRELIDGLGPAPRAQMHDQRQAEPVIHRRHCSLLNAAGTIRGLWLAGCLGVVLYELSW